MKNKKIGNSIFRFEQEAGIDSKLGNWRKLLHEKHNILNNKKEESRYDFLPVVKINKSENAKNAIISIKECANHKINKISLGNDYDKDKQNYLVADIVIAKNSVVKIPLIIKRGYDPWGFQDEDGILEFKSSNRSIQMDFIDNDDTDYKDNKPKYDLNNAEYGDEFVLEINASALARGTSFTISVYASDDKEEGVFGTSSNRKGICGKFNMKVVEKDVFFPAEIKKGIKEILYISSKHKKRPTTGEYSENYCIQAADRFLGKLLNNTTNFYTYNDETNQRIFVPDLKNAAYRAKQIKSLGYGKILKEFDGSIFKIIEIKATDEYGNNPKRVLSLKPNNRLKLFLKQQIKNKIGFHIFYLSIVDGFHTLIMVIDNTKPCLANYEIYDEDGLSSSKGDVDSIDEGIVHQAQWVYSWTKKNYGYWPKLKMSILKIKRK